MIPVLLRRRGDFRLYWAGQAISLFGDQITAIALPLVAVLVLGAGPAAMGYLVACAWLPYLFFAIPAGAWVDRRRSRRRVMVVADAGRALLLVSVPVAAALHVLTLVQLYAVIFLSGTLSAFFSTAQASLFNALVKREDYVQASSLLFGSRAFSLVGGPAVGGILIQLLTAPVAMIADAASFVVSALALARIRPVEPPPDAPTKGSLLSGVRFILDSPLMRAQLLATSTINLFNLAFSALLILYLVRYVHIGPAVLGVLLGCGFVGGLAGSVLTSRIGRRIGVGPTYIAGCVLFTAPLLLVPSAAGPQLLVFALVLLAVFLAGFGVMMLDINAGAIRAALVPSHLLARVSGAYTVVNYGVRPVGSVAGGALAAAIGVRPTLFIVAAGAVLGVLWLLPSPLPALRELPQTSGQPEALPAAVEPVPDATR